MIPQWVKGGSAYTCMKALSNRMQKEKLNSISLLEGPGQFYGYM